MNYTFKHTTILEQVLNTHSSLPNHGQGIVYVDMSHSQELSTKNLLKNDNLELSCDQKKNLSTSQKIKKGKRNYPKNRRARTLYSSDEERKQAKKEQNRLGVLRWRQKKENKNKEKELLKKYREKDGYKEKMHDYYTKWYQNPENKKKVQVAHKKWHLMQKQRKLELSDHQVDGKKVNETTKSLPNNYVDLDKLFDGIGKETKSNVILPFWEDGQDPQQIDKSYPNSTCDGVSDCEC